MRKFFGILCGFSLMLALLCISIASVAFSPGRLLHYQRQYGVSVDHLEMRDEAICRYLSGRDGVLEGEWTEQETLHMADVRKLFRMLRTVFFAGTICCLLSSPLAGRKALFTGVGVFWTFLLGTGIWAAVDFEGWFYVMHSLAFDNMLWLFDPAESALIKMMPLAFFIRCVIVIGAQLLAMTGFLILLIFILSQRVKRHERRK